jgi:Nuclear pore complex scaffold, nucleoporins 186/192/205
MFSPASAPGGAFGSSNTQAAPASSAFTYGGGTSQQTPSSGALGFGATSQPAQAPTNAPFSYAAPAQPASTTAPSFASGSTPANASAPGTFVAPASTGYSFGGAGAAPAPTPPSFFGSTPATSTATFGGFSLNGPSPASHAFGSIAPVPTPGAYSFGGSTTSGAASAGPPAQPSLEVPDKKSVFPNEEIFSEISRVLKDSALPSQEGRTAAFELVDRLKCDESTVNGVGSLLSNPKTLTYKDADANIRNQLHNNPTILLPGKRQATLVPEMLAEVISIADDLRISEQEALCLFWEVSNKAKRADLADQLGESFIDKSLSSDGLEPLPPIDLGTNVMKAAKELYFHERRQLMKLVLLLLQSRLQSGQLPWGELIIQASDSLIQNNLVDNLIRVIREWTVIIGQFEHHLARGTSSNTYSSSVFAQDMTMNKSFDTVHLQFAVEERQTAAECLFYLAYNTQFTEDEVAALIDVVRDLTNGSDSQRGLPILNPFQDVPSSFVNPPQLHQPWAPYQGSPGPLKLRKSLDWEKELVKETRQTSMPDLLRCVSALVVTLMSALDTKQSLIDRHTHRENSFGVVGARNCLLLVAPLFLELTCLLLF